MIDLSLRALFAHANGKPYAITTTFDGKDLINGGMHMAVDVGNVGMDDPILAPRDGRARGLYHFDGAIGIEDDLGNGWTLQRWHLNSTLAAGLAMTPGRSDVGDWVDVTRGQVVGRTGNTGAPVNGKPMPAHTHIELERGGTRYDVGPHLLGKPFDPTIQEDDMRLPAGMLSLTYAELGPKNRIRTDPATTEGSRVTKAVERVQVLGWVDRPDAPWEIGAARGTTWYLIGLGLDAGYVATALLPSVRPTALGASILPKPDCSALEGKLARARTAVSGARQAVEAAEGVLA